MNIYKSVGFGVKESTTKTKPKPNRKIELGSVGVNRFFRFYAHPYLKSHAQGLEISKANPFSFIIYIETFHQDIIQLTGKSV